MTGDNANIVNSISNLSSLILINKPAFISIIRDSYRRQGLDPKISYFDEYQSVYLLPMSGTSAHLNIMESINSIKPILLAREINKYQFLAETDFLGRSFDDYFNIEFREYIDTYFIETHPANQGSKIEGL